MRKAKTNLKRVLSILLVTAMVLTGNVFSGLEVKAAEMTGETVGDLLDETTGENVGETDVAENDGNMADGDGVSGESTETVQKETDVKEDETKDEDIVDDGINIVVEDNNFENNKADDTGFIDNEEILEDTVEGNESVTFYYYYGNDPESKPGVNFWGSNISTTADAADVYAWAEGDIRAMTVLADYPGWYSIDVTFTDSGTGSGFDLYAYTDEEVDTSLKVFQCSESNWKDIYEKLVSGEVVAVKGNHFYVGDAVAAIQRNITLSVYDDAGVPVIMAKGSKLSYVDEDAGEVIELTADDYDDTYGNYYYSMIADEVDENWYYLTWSVPVTVESKLYRKTSNYEWVKDFVYAETENEWEVDITPVFEGKLHYENGAFYTLNISLGRLKELVESKTVEKILQNGESNYKKDTWDAFYTALNEANTLINTYNSAEDTTEADDITKNYNALKNAVRNLTEKSVSFTFYYYNDDTNNKPGFWFKNNAGDNISTTANPADVQVEAEGDTYVMTESEYYPGWYSIDIQFTNPEANSEFKIYSYSGSVINKDSAMFTCSAEGENSDIYAKLAAGEAETYAVKGNHAYAGNDVAVLQRNMILYVYNNASIPIVMSGKAKLSGINANTGNVEELTIESYQDDWENYYYQMIPDEVYDDWYYLEFSVPTEGEQGKLFQLYQKSGETDQWLKNFVSGWEDDDSVNVTPIFSGKTYYKDGQFYERQEVIEGINLGNLKELVDSEAVVAILQKGKDNYTESTWDVFESALNAAATLIGTTYKDAVDTTEADDITNAYTDLKKAVDEIVENGVIITLYYYNNSVQTKPGFWYKDNGEENISTTAEPVAEGEDTYVMTACRDYAGWYSIDVKFVNPGANSEFKIYSYAESGVDKENAMFSCAAEGDNKDIYAQLVSGAESEYAVKSDQVYAGKNVSAIQRNVTLYVYDNASIPVIMCEKSKLATGLSYVNEKTGTVEKLTADNYDDGNGNFYYSMTADETAPNWYYITLSLPDVTQGSKFCNLYEKTTSEGTDSYVWKKDWVNGATENNWEADASLVFLGKVYYKDGVFSEVKEIVDDLEALKKSLDELIAEAKKYSKADLKEESWNALEKALNDAKAVAAKEEPTKEEVDAAYTALSDAISALVYATKAEVNVQKVFVGDDFITGADLSSYISLVESGAVFRDEDGNPLDDAGFFKKIADGGTNWVRIRLWDNPYDANGNGYGGGNNDIEKAITIGQLANGAGMKVLIDFHYSDFWVDPSKYAAPKAWRSMTLEQKEEALYNHTYDNLKKLHDAGVSVGMVQVGNETNSGIAGETSEENMKRLFQAGSKAVRDFSEKYLSDRNAIMIAVHFTDPQDGYEAIARKMAEVDYDVFATSYYPYWHENATAEGDTTSLRQALTYVAETYGKKVMVAETSWATTWEDGDGHDNTAPKTSGQNLQYDISVQGQVDEMRAVVAAVNSVPNGIGVFYWEPAWIPVAFAYNEDGSLNEEQLATNKNLWEQYGSGWASSYSAEFDPDDAGKWYGGSAIDNQAWFDFEGRALASVNTYRYIRSGASAELDISYVPKNTETEAFVGGTVKYPEEIEVKFNNGTKGTGKVVWDEEQVALVSTDKVGEYYIDGIVTCTYQNSAGKDVTKTYSVMLTVKVKPIASSNQLENPGFENGSTGWTIKYVTKNADGTETETTEAPSGSTYTIQPTNENPYSGIYGMNFYRGDAGLSFRVCQEITGLDAGNYDFGGFIQGGSAGGDDLSYAYVKVYSVGEDGKRELDSSYRSSCALSGWQNWSQPEISGFALEQGQIIEVGFEINTSVPGSWGSIDDAYLYGSYGVNVDPDLKNAAISLSDTVARVGEKVRFNVIADSGYIVDDAKISLYRLDANNEKVSVTAEESGLEVKEAQGAFIMLKYPVYITAEAKSIGDIASEKPNGAISMEEVNVVLAGIQPYTGKDVKPAVTLKYGNYTLAEKKDYTLKYKDNKEVGTATVTATGKGSFKGEKSATFEIKKATNLKDATVTILGENSTDNKGTKCYLYTGTEIEPEIEVKIPGLAGEAGVTLEDGRDYILDFSNNIKAGTATVYIIANESNGLYTGSVKKTFKIVKPNLAELHNAETDGITVSYSKEVEYTGKALKPNITIKYGNLTLKRGVDYTVSYKKNTSVAYDVEGNVVAAGVITVKGKGNFTGQFTKNFKVSPKSLGKSNISATVKTLTYNDGKKLNPSVSVTVGGTTKLKVGRDFDITNYEYQKDNEGSFEKMTDAVIKEMGTYRLTLAGRKNYTGEITVTFKVVDRLHNIANAKIKVNVSKDYTGTQVKLMPGQDGQAELLVSFGSNSPLNPETDYDLVFENNTNAGKKAKVTVIGKGEYAGEKSAFYTINAIDISALSEEAFTAGPSTKGAEDVTQYYTGYTLAPDFGVNWVPAGKALQKGVDYTIAFKNNVSGKKKDDGKYYATATIKGKGNFKGSRSVEFEIVPTKLSDFTVSVSTVTYNGKAQKPAITFVQKGTGKTFDLKANTAYTAQYKNAKNAGTGNSYLGSGPCVTIKEKGLNFGVAKSEKRSETVYFNITTAKIDASSVAPVKTQTFAGKAVKPALTVKVGGKKLKLNKDYTVKFENNALRGEASVTVTGIGNYSGTAVKKFKIK